MGATRRGETGQGQASTGAGAALKQHKINKYRGGSQGGVTERGLRTSVRVARAVAQMARLLTASHAPFHGECGALGV